MVYSVICAYLTAGAGAVQGSIDRLEATARVLAESDDDIRQLVALSEGLQETMGSVELMSSSLAAHS